MTDLPENYQERLIKAELGLQRLTLKVLDVYDLVLSKLTRNGSEYLLKLTLQRKSVPLR